MTITRPAPATAPLHQPITALRRWANALTFATPRARRTRRRTTLAHAPAPPPSVWTLDRTELTTALQHSHW